LTAGSAVSCLDICSCHVVESGTLAGQHCLYCSMQAELYEKGTMS
jgi:hypothetical protein